ncbi:DNA adenine methylase, partial [Nosocomiicoccus sp. HMSC059G07]|uniref:DNA adenine methylase n=1 Tax=Nosocomiicoccus sp. HMSC059G07 TaxID=1739531 RepID=UPI000B20D29C
SIALYVLIAFSFNNQIRFNSSGDFNIPTGKRDFNSQMESKLIEFKEAISGENIEFSNEDFRVIIKNIVEKDSFVYLDPPYLISTASYNEMSGWTKKDEYDLLNQLDELN